MGGPIIRTGTTPAYWDNWERAFGGKKKSTAKPAAKGAKKASKPAKSAKSKAARKKKKK
ncbi:MAG: RNA polymerase subunit sigma [Planctomycetaceae bacterium]